MNKCGIACVGKTQNRRQKKTLLNDPNLSNKFKIHPDGSDTQLGLVIALDGKPIAIYH